MKASVMKRSASASLTNVDQHKLNLLASPTATARQAWPSRPWRFLAALLILLMGWGSSATGQTIVQIKGSGNGNIESSVLDQYDDDCQVQITVVTEQDRNNWGIGRCTYFNNWNTQDVQINFVGLQTSPFIYTYTIGDLKRVARNGETNYKDNGGTGVCFNFYNDCSLEKVEVIVPVKDAFLNTWRGTQTITTPPAEEISDKEHTSSMTVNYGQRKTASPKYARVYLTDASGAGLDSWDTSLLEVTYNGVPATQGGTSATNGVYVSDASGLDFSKLKVTLKAGAGNFKKYKVVTIFSTDAKTAGQEPAWDERYIYSYTYPFGTYTLTDNEASSSSFFMEKQDEIFEALGVSNADGFCGKWYNRWYVLDDNDHQVSNVASAENAQSGSWTFKHWYLNTDGTTYDSWPYNRWVKNGDYIVGRSGQGDNSTDNWFVNRTLAKHVEIFPPSGRLSDYAGYKIVFELDNDYSGGDPDIKLRYTLIIPSTFLGKAKSDVSVQQKTLGVAETDAQATVDLSAAYDAASAQGADKVYVRLFVANADGTLAADQSGLTIKPKTAGSWTKHADGYGYLYYGTPADALAELQAVTVSVASGKLYNSGQHVGVVLSKSPFTGLNFDGGDDAAHITEEPDWDAWYVYGFKSGFYGELADDALKVEKTFKQDVKDWAADTREYFINFNFTDGTIQLVNAAKNVVASLSMTDEEKTFWQTFAPGGTVPKETPFYLRWHLRSKLTGQEVSITDALRSGNTGNDYIDGVNGVSLVNLNSDHASRWFNNYRLYDWEERKLQKILRVKVDGTPGDNSSPSTAFLLTDYDLVLQLSTNDSGKPTERTDNLTQEPDYFQAQYIFHFATLFEAGNIDDPTLKTKYKTLIYDESTRQVNPALFSNWYEVAADCETTRTGLAKKGYARWYLVDKASGQRIDMPADGLKTYELEKGQDGNLKSQTEVQSYTSLNNSYGYYRLAFEEKQLLWANPASRNIMGVKEGWDTSKNGIGYYMGYDPVITLPGGYSYDNVRVVCVVTTLTDGFDASNISENEPWKMQVKYIYDLMTEQKLQEQPFVHYRGVHYPDYHYADEDARGYAEESGNAGGTELSWDYKKNGIETGTFGNIRQQVHSYDYHVFLNLSDGEKATLMLPFLYYDGEIHYELDSNGEVSKSGNDPVENTGSDTEPMGYIRWYNWSTDAADSRLVKVAGESNQLRQLMSNGVDRGWYAVMLNDKPNKNNVGVEFVAPSGFSSMTDEIVIACDVSRYMDGMDDSKQYLVHEPTLSTRYLFHILPAQVQAKKMAEAATTFNSVMADLKAGKKLNSDVSAAMYDEAFKLMENNGRTVVSLNSTQGHFALRTDLEQLGYYYVESGSELKACDRLQWVAYIEEGNDVYELTVPMKKTWTDYKDQIKYNRTADGGTVNTVDDERGQRRLGIYELSDLAGTYTKLGSQEAKDFGVGDLQRVRMVAFLYNSTAQDDKVPTVSVDLNFIDAAPLPLGSETEERKENFMGVEYTHAATLDFDDFFDDDLTVRFQKPEISWDNYAKIPMKFANAQYGFCYPQLYGQEATNWQIHHGGWWEGYGISPLHGDYILLKSMNMKGVSQTRGAEQEGGGHERERLDDQQFYSLWYNDSKLYDVTHERTSGKGDGGQYGTFFYVDAADEARTIGQLEFDAQFCAGSHIYYSAYIADMTNGMTTPQVRFRVYTFDPETHARIDVASFLTGDIASEGATEKGQWYQVYGYTNVPAELANQLTGSSMHYYVDVDNFCENTRGADYAIDQICFFTSSAKVKAVQLNDVCDDNEGTRVQITADAEELMGYFTPGQTYNLYYRIYERNSDVNHVLQENEALTGAGVYNDNLTEVGNQYGTVSFTAQLPTDIPVYADAKSLPSTFTSGFYRLTSDGADGPVYFLITDRYFNLKSETEYFVSFYTLGDERVSGLEGWGCPYGDRTCSVYSNGITPRRMFIEMSVGSDVSDGKVAFDCGTNSATKDFAISVKYPTADGSFKEYDEVKFDFFLGTKEEFNSTKGLKEALDHFRSQYPDAGSVPGDYSHTETIDGETVDYKTVLDAAISGGKLLLSHAGNFTHTFTVTDQKTPETQYYLALPIDREVEEEGEICSPIQLEFLVDPTANGPKLALGFDDVDYPAEYTKRVVRMGLEQISKMQTGGYKLHIPIHSYSDKSQGNESRLHFTNSQLTLSATDDPTCNIDAEHPVTVATIIAPEHAEEGDQDVYVSTSRMFLPLQLAGGFTFHEGYYYEVSTSFFDKDDEGITSRCQGDLYIVFRVVPEFVTWEAQQIGDSQYYNANWYNDGNWHRSTRAQLYKDGKGGSQNTKTDGHPNGYEDNGEMDSKLVGNPGFVPMKFTYVTMPGGAASHAPSLINEPREADGSVQTGGWLINKTSTELLTDVSPYVSTESSAPSDFIRYDMLVRYGAHGEGGEGCFGHRHRTKTGGAWGWANDRREDMTSFNNAYKAFDVEKFYGNICREIYFKPGAELLRQQRLTYNRAWVEKELEPNKWYLVASPLQDTYAGDMYVPVSMEDVADNSAVKGRQATEAFQPISFSTSATTVTDGTATSTPAYSRTKYPIYQRSWNTSGAKVYTRTNDARATDYNANLPYASVSSVDVEWSHTYNDVQVPYTTLTGFSIRALKKSALAGEKTLIRLPKADTQYDYYRWDNTSPADGKLTHTVKRNLAKERDGNKQYPEVTGNHALDNSTYWVEQNTSRYSLPSRYEDGITQNYRLLTDGGQKDGVLTVPVAQLQQQDGYLLVGNPYMASIDMRTFFAGNAELSNDHRQEDENTTKDTFDYWTYEGSEAKAYQVEMTSVTAPGGKVSRSYVLSSGGTELDDKFAGIVRPTQAFFVRKKGADQISFTRSMTIDGNFPKPDAEEPSPVRPAGVTLRAAGSQGGSSATVQLSAEAVSGYLEGEDVETLFDSNLAQVPMVYTVAGGQAVSIDQRPQLDAVPFGVVCAAADGPVEVALRSSLAPLTLYVVDAVTGRQTEVGESGTVLVQPNDYGRYFLTTTSRLEQQALTDDHIVISVRHQQVTVAAATALNAVAAYTLDGRRAFSHQGGAAQCTFQLAPGVYVIDARSHSGLHRRLKVVVN